ncbi:MAG: hypothetical protein ACK5VI_05115 [Opitutia bacterium]
MRLSRTTLLLLAANLVCAGLIWRALPSAEQALERGLTFPTVPSSVVIEGPSGKIRLERSDGGWLITEPFRWSANPWQVQRLLGELALVREAPSRPAAADAKERWKVTVAAEGGATVAATVVAETGASGARSALLDGGERGGATGGEPLLKALALGAEDYRVDAVFSIPAFEARAISVRRSRAGAEDVRWGLVLETREQVGKPEPAPAWRFEAPVNLAADAERMPRAVNALADLRVARFLPRRESTDAKPRLRISLEGASRREVLLAWEAKDGLVEACLEDNPGQPFLLEEKGLALWEDPVAELRSRQPCDFDPAGATGVTLTHLSDQRTLTLHRLETAGAAGRWEMPVVPGSTATRRLEVSVGRVQQFLRLLTGLRAGDGREATPPPGLDWHRVEIDFAGGKLAYELAADAGRVLVRAPGGPALACPTDQPMARWLSVLPENWRTETVARLPAGTQVARLEILAPDGKPLASARLGEAGRWLAEGEISASQASALAERLAHVQARSFAPDAPAGGARARAWQATVRVTDRSAAGAAGASEATRAYRCGAGAGPGALLMRDESDGTVFQPEPGLAEALAPWVNP